MAIASIAVVVLIVNKSHWGLALKATGSNARSAYLLGTNINYTAISAFLFAGALAGTAGAHRVLFTYGSLRPLASGGIGFLGLLIVLLVSNRVLFVPFAAFGFAAIMAGSTRLKVSLQIDPSLANSMQGILVLAGLLVSGIRRRLHHG
jgi:simple sugar transport system permease protein